MNFLKTKIILVIGLFLNVPAQAEIHFLSDTSVAPGTKFQNTTVGGLSALVKSKEGYFALSDDKGKINEPRIYRYDILLKEGKLAPEIKEVITLKGKSNEALLDVQIDPEGLVVLEDGSFLVSSEGNINFKPRQGPQIFHFNRTGKMLGELKLPTYFNAEPQGEQKTGIRNNLGPEGLSLTPSGKYLYVAFENVLVQDGDETSFDKEGFIRILKYENLKNKSWKLVSQKTYPMAKVTKPTKDSVLLGTGVSEIKALDDSHLLVLERSVSQQLPAIFSDIKIFEIDFSTGDEVKDNPSLKGLKIKSVEKNLVADLAKFLPKFKGDKSLDNMEALELGPQVDGKNTLIVLSDDNFSEFQRSLWLLLQL